MAQTGVNREVYWIPAADLDVILEALNSWENRLYNSLAGHAGGGQEPESARFIIEGGISGLKWIKVFGRCHNCPNPPICPEIGTNPYPNISLIPNLILPITSRNWPASCGALLVVYDLERLAALHTVIGIGSHHSRLHRNDSTTVFTSPI